MLICFGRTPCRLRRRPETAQLGKPPAWLSDERRNRHVYVIAARVLDVSCHRCLSGRARSTRAARRASPDPNAGLIQGRASIDRAVRRWMGSSPPFTTSAEVLGLGRALGICGVATLSLSGCSPCVDSEGAADTKDRCHRGRRVRCRQCPDHRCRMSAVSRVRRCTIRER